MPNSTITNVDLGSVILKDAAFRDELLVFTAAGTVAEGTILARHTGGTTPSNKLVPFVVGGIEGRGIPLALVTYDVTAAAAGDVAIRAGVAGRYRKERLVIAADGDDRNVTNAVIDQLRDYGLVPEDVQELAILDNQ